MSDASTNLQGIPNNTCFGCGESNPQTLGLTVRRDPDRDDRLLGHWKPGPDHCGFPGMIHGGLLYTTMDCMAAWTVNALRKEEGAFWILRSANVTYHNPARPGQDVHLNGTMEVDGGEWSTVVIRVESRADDDTLLVDGSYKFVPLTQDRLKSILGIDEIPENWREFLSGP